MLATHNLINLEKEPFESAIKKDFGLEITNTIKIDDKGYSNQVYKGNLLENIVYIRINKDPNIFDVEVAGYKIFEQQGIPVPKVISYIQNPTSIGYPTMIMSCARGVSLKESNISPEQNNIIYEKMGNLVKKINETKLNGYGPLKVIDGKIVGLFPTWKEYCELRNEPDNLNLKFCVENNFVTIDESEKIMKIFKEISLLDFGKSSLIHRDIHKNHVYITGDEITGIIDLGALTASDPRYDITNSLVFQNKTEQEYFKHGYGELANDPMVNKYLINILIRKIYFRSQDKIKGNVQVLLTALKDALEKEL